MSSIHEEDIPVNEKSLFAEIGGSDEMNFPGKQIIITCFGMGKWLI